MDRLLIVFFLLLTPGYLMADGGDPQSLLRAQVSKHLKWANEMHGLKLTYQSVSMPNGPIRQAVVSVYTTKKVDIPEVRKLFIHCTRDLIDRLNSDKRLRIWLLNYPVTYKDIGYSISFDGLKSGAVLSPSIATVRMGRGEIVYVVWDADKKDEVEILRENYLDGVSKMQVENAESSRATNLPG